MTNAEDTSIAAGDPPAALEATPQRKLSAVFYGTGAAMARIALDVAVLNLITLGVYRFWGKTKLRRYLWEATELDGDRFRYHGTAVELLIGFLIVLAILAPLALLDSQLRLLLQVADPDAEVNSLIFYVYNLVYIIIVIFLINFAVYRMWRYRLSRTSWRGVRFALTGSAVRYALWGLLWLVAVIFSLGLAAPWAKAALAGRILGEARFGSARFSSNARVDSNFFIKHYLPLYGILFCMFVFYGFLFFIFALIWFQAVKNGQTVYSILENANILLFIMPALVFLALLVAAFFFNLRYRLRFYEYMIGGLSLGRVGFSAAIPVWPVFRAWLTMAFAALLLLSLPVLIMVLNGDSSLYLFLAMALLIAALVAYQALNYGIFFFALVKNLCAGTEIRNCDALADVLQGSEKEPAYGEGLADAMDVGAF